MHIEELITPALVVDYNVLIRNIQRMSDRARKFRVSLRPHIKTHKCIEIAELQRKHGARGITVSTVYEALIFEKAGFDDITLAMPLAHDKFPIVQAISENTSLKVIVDHPLTVHRLSEFCKENRFDLDVLIKVDVGYHRCGVNPRDNAAVELAKEIVAAPNLQFKGILTHGGHAYNGTTVMEIQQAAREEQEMMLLFADTLAKQDSDLIPEVISIGSTPGMSLTMEVMDGITEIRPGNYVFNDYEQVVLGACKIEDCALHVIASVIGEYNNRIVLDAGATTLSVDSGPSHIEPECGFGKILSLKKQTLDELKIIGLSQEHGKVMIKEKKHAKKFAPGMKLRIIPNHSCLTANLADQYHIIKNNHVDEIWRIHRGHFRKNRQEQKLSQK